MDNTKGSGKPDCSGDHMESNPSMGTTSRKGGAARPADGAKHTASIAMPSMGTMERKKTDKGAGDVNSHGSAMPSAGTTEKV